MSEPARVPEAKPTGAPRASSGSRSLAAITIALAACSGGSGHDAPPLSDGGRTRRVILPPSGEVRALPPHAIDAGGVGPYRLGATPSEVADALPTEGPDGHRAYPRVLNLDIEGVIDASVVRAEKDSVLVGGRPGEPVSFIAVLAPGIAKTAGGIMVGVHRADLAPLGPPLAAPDTARDPHLVRPASLPGASFLVDNDRVTAILLERMPEPTPAPAVARDAGLDAGPGDCDHALPAPEGDLLAAAAVKPADVATAQVRGACLLPGLSLGVVTSGDELSVIDADAGHARRVTVAELHGLVWAAPVLAEPDREDIVAVSESRTDSEIVASLAVLRLENGHLVRLLDDAVYQLPRTRAQWIGAKLEDLRLLLTVTARPDSFEVGGILVHAGLTGVREVAPLVPVSVTRRRHPVAETPTDTDAGVATPRDAREPRDAH